MLAVLLVAMLSALWGCSSTSSPAPVHERSPGATKAPSAASSSAVPSAAAPSSAVPRAAAAAVQPRSTVGAAPIAEGGSAASATELPPARLEAPPVIKPYREGDWRPEFHMVRKGDTLYSIALDYGEGYRDLAAWNRLEDPAKIRIDQKIRLFAPESSPETALPQPVPLPAEPVPAPVALKTGPKAQKLPYSEQALAQLSGTAQAVSPEPGVTPTPAAVPAPAIVKPPVAPAVATAGTTRAPVAPTGKLVWEWPTEGPVTYNFGKGVNQKGIGIEGKPGQPVLAGAPGKVVYSGSGLRGYGKLIIIKHDATYLSVYAHNSQILVKEGQTVAKGQKIAEMGSSDSDWVGLHFEIRRLGNPIDPQPHLPARGRLFRARRGRGRTGASRGSRHGGVSGNGHSQ